MHCIQCKRPFKAEPEHQLFHSSRCRNLWRKQHPSCFYCGEHRKLIERDHIFAFIHRENQPKRLMRDETVPACKSCNLILREEEPRTVLARFDFLIARFLRRGGIVRGKNAERYRQLLIRQEVLITIMR